MSATAPPAPATGASRPGAPQPAAQPTVQAAESASPTATRALDTSSLLATQPLAPFIEYLVDPTGALSVDELLSPSHQAAFAPLGNGLPVFRSGSTWLRLTLAPRSADGQNRQLLLDLGRDLPGSATLFLAKRNLPGEPNEWQAQAPEGGNVFTLPDPVGKPVPVYIKLDGVPGPWFAPMLRTPQNAAANNDALARPLVIGVLVAVLALCLLRGIFEKGEWRLWTSLFAAAVLIQAVAGQPSTPAGYVPLTGLPGVLAPGLALMLLPHVGRHLLRTREKASSADMQLRVVSLAGALLTLLPLAPRMAWTSRLLALWPMLLVLVLPAALSCMLRKLPGSRRFLTGCLAALAGAGVGLVGLASPVPAVWISTAPLWGLALLALLVAGTSAPRLAEADGVLTGGRGYRVRKSPAAERPDLDDPLADEPTLRLISPTELRGETRGDAASSPHAPGAPGASAFHDDTDEEPMELSLGDVLPELDSAPAPRHSRRLARAAAAMAGIERSDAGDMFRPASHQPPDAPSGPDASFDPLAMARMEEALLTPIDAMLQELDGLENCALPPAARSHAEALAAAGRQLASIAGDLGRVATPQRTAPRRAVFDLQRMLREAHDAVADRAERKGLAISWFMAPHLSQLYEGDAGPLGELLRLLAESSVRSTDKGSVHMSVRRVPDSTDPGHLLFTVSDSGAGAPPHKRSVSALARAWEMADDAEGTLTVESGHGQGTTISFTVRLVALSGDATAPRPFVGVDLTDDLRVARPAPDAAAPVDHLHQGPMTPRRPLQVIVADDVPSNRQLLAFFLEGLPHAPLEARGATEAGILYRRAPSGLVIMDGDMPEDDIVAALASIRAFEQEHDLPLAPVLALVANEAQASRMLAAGCTETLEKPLTRSGLRAAVGRLAPPLPEPEPQYAHADHDDAGYGQYTDMAHESPEGAGDPSEEGSAGASPYFAQSPDLFLSGAGGDYMPQAWDTGADDVSADLDVADNAPAPDMAPPTERLDDGGAHSLDAPEPAPSSDAEDAWREPDEALDPTEPVMDTTIMATTLTTATTSWHPWDSPTPPPSDARPAGQQPDQAGEAMQHPAATHDDVDSGAEELPDLFGADIFAVPHADPAAHNQAAASVAASASGMPYGGGALPEGGSLLDLIVTDAPDSEADNGTHTLTASTVYEAPTTASATPAALARPATSAPVTATPTTSTPDADAAQADAQTDAHTPAWDDDFEESVGDPMPVAATATPQAATARPQHSDKPQADAANGARKSAPMADSGEWVGEPMPMDPHRATTHGGSSASSSYGAAARLERWERAQRAQQQAQRTAQQAPPTEHSPVQQHSQPHDPRPIRDVSAEVRPGYRPKQQPAPSAAPAAAPSAPSAPTTIAGTAPLAQPQAVQAPSAPQTPPAWPTAQQAPQQPLPPQMQYTRPQPNQPNPQGQPGGQPVARPAAPASAAQGLSVHAQTAQAPTAQSQAGATPPAPPAKSFAERIAERIAMHLGRSGERTPGNDAGTARHAPAQPARSDDGARTGRAAPASGRDELAGRPSGPAQRPSAPGGQRPEPHAHNAHMGDDIEPFIPGLLETLDAALEDARRGRADGSTFAVQEAAARIAGKSESFGLRVLERIARCVERAATADDMEAVRDLLPELEAAVERNRIALASRVGHGGRRS